jgi:hypothetical protein
MNHIVDQREPVFRKVGKRYVECGKINSPYIDGGSWEGNRKDGLWLHTSTNHSKCMSFISTLEDLKLPANQIAALHLKKEELLKHLVKKLGSQFSLNEVAQYAIDFIYNSQSQE